MSAVVRPQSYYFLNNILFRPIIGPSFSVQNAKRFDCYHDSYIQWLVGSVPGWFFKSPEGRSNHGSRNGRRLETPAFTQWSCVFSVRACLTGRSISMFSCPGLVPSYIVSYVRYFALHYLSPVFLSSLVSSLVFLLSLLSYLSHIVVSQPIPLPVLNDIQRPTLFFSLVLFQAPPQLSL